METATATRTEPGRANEEASRSRPERPAGRQAGNKGRKPPLPRRVFLVDRPTQLRSIAIVGLFAIILLIPINLGVFVLHTTIAAQVANDAPTLVRTIEDQNRAAARGIWIGSGIIVLAAMWVTLFATHRTAGAAVGLVRGLQNLREGKYGSMIVLRRADRLRNVEKAVNDLSRTLLERSSQLAEELEREADALDRVSDPGESRAIAERLRRMASRERIDTLPAETCCSTGRRPCSPGDSHRCPSPDHPRRGTQPR